MKKALLLALLASWLAAPAGAATMMFDVEGTFTEEGLISDGSFEGTFSYASDAPDVNPIVTNAGLFELDEFEIQVFDEQLNEVEMLTEDNSTAHIALTSSPADGSVVAYTLQTVPDDFFGTGTLVEVEFNFPAADPNEAPQIAPGEFQDGAFAPAGTEGIVNPQEIATAAIMPASPSEPPEPPTPEPVSTPEPASWVGLGVAMMAIAGSKLKSRAS
ncbi:MAG: hypothetical protein AAFQ89_06605 [Cyanobacteria bacterium J06626_18]